MGREIQATGGSNHPATDAFFFFLFSSVVAPVQPSEQTSLKEHCGSIVFSSFFSSFFFFGSTASITFRYSSTISPCNNSAAIVMTLLRVQTDYQKRGANTNRGRALLAQNDNVLIAQSRNVLLTRSGWGGGIRNTSHDPAGPRSVDRSEKGQEGANHTASGRRRDRPNRTAYPAAAGKAEKRGRPGGGPRAPGTSVQPQTGREEPGEGGCDPRAREVSRVRPHAGQRIPWQASPDHSQPRNGEGLDDRSAAMAVPETKSGESPRVAPAAATVRRTGAVGHQRAPMAGRARAEALPDQHDRRCHQPAACTFCSPRLDRGKHAFAVELFGAPWTSAELLHRQGEPVSNRAQDPAGFHRTAPRRARTTAAHANWTGASRSGDRLDRSPLATGQGTGGTQFSDGAGPSGERLACGGSHDSGASQCLPGNRVHSLVEPDSGCRAGHGGRCTPSARQGPFAAGFVELCRKPRSRQWVHDPVRQQDLPDRPHGYSCRPARSSGADRSPAGWIHGRSLPRSLPGSERVFGAPQSSGACQETQKTRHRPTSEKSVDEKLLLHQSRQGRSFRDPSKTHSVGRAKAARTPRSRTWSWAPTCRCAGKSSAGTGRWSPGWCRWRPAGCT